MRIESIHFKNYKLLRDATLPLEPLTVIVGPNGSGKSSALEALADIAPTLGVNYVLQGVRTQEVLEPKRTIGTDPSRDAVEITVSASSAGRTFDAVWSSGLLGNSPGEFKQPPAAASINPAALVGSPEAAALLGAVRSFRSYALMPDRMREPSQPAPESSLSIDGKTIAATLDQMRDRNPDALDALNGELARWIPEYDRVLFETPERGHKAVALRTRSGGHRIGARQLSSGTLLALGLLTVVYDDSAEGGVIGIEEPEVGIHPRLLRNVFDALVRVAYPAENDINRPPRQVIVTTHSPYFLDLFTDLPAGVVIADRKDDAVTFTRLADHPDVDQIVLSAPLGESWFTGVLGGVPVGLTPPTIHPAKSAA